MNKSGAPGPLAIVRGFRKHRHISKVGMFSNPGFDLFMQIEIRPCPPAPIKRELPTALPGELLQKNGADRRISSATCAHDCWLVGLAQKKFPSKTTSDRSGKEV